MKIILSAILLAVGLFSNSFAEIDSTAGCWWQISYTTTNVRVTGTTAANIIPKTTITPGVDYIIACQDSIGGTTDSAYSTCIVYGADGSTVLWSEVVNVHRAAGSRYQTFRLPIGITAFGKWFKVTFTRYNATNKSNIVRAELIKRAPMTTNIDHNSNR